MASPQAIAVSALSQVEVLGYHQLTEAERELFGEFFESCPVLPISDQVVVEAIALRQQRRLSLGDAVIAATGLVHNLPIATRNTKDFEWMDGLEVVNPLNLN